MLFLVGVRNITALGNVVRWQKLEYDFSFHKQDFNTNLPVLILSEGRSMIQVHLNKTVLLRDRKRHTDRDITSSSPTAHRGGGGLSYCLYIGRQGWCPVQWEGGGSAMYNGPSPHTCEQTNSESITFRILRNAVGKYV